ncbi:SAVED domain-containing protein [Micromonospora sp. LOL_024]|uniref:SAVED domain-containing protein n=1 Tax=Micromonospora sp. LOL_024 TaxID=3345412 RepID=UPI003A86828F
MNKILVWAKAAGRCTFCNTPVVEAAELGEPVPIGELAHNVGWSESSPRGEDPLSFQQRADASNLILACRNCHKPIDDGGVAGRYTVEELKRRKQEHESRIESLTAIGADRSAYVLRIVGDVRGVPAELARPTVLAATTAAGLYPRILPGSHWDSDADLDLRNRGDLNTMRDFERLASEITDFTKRVHDGVRRDVVTRIAVFAFARIPLLVALGARLDDKVHALVFQRHRTDAMNAWTWPSSQKQLTLFRVTRVRMGNSSQSVTLLLNLSGTIHEQDLPAETTSDHHIYTISPVPPAEPGPTLVTSPADLASFEGAMREFLATVEADHGKLDAINVFAAVGISSAVTIGRVLMPHVSPALDIYDRSDNGSFFLALRVRR